MLNKDKIRDDQILENDEASFQNLELDGNFKAISEVPSETLQPDDDEEKSILGSDAGTMSDDSQSSSTD